MRRLKCDSPKPFKRKNVIWTASSEFGTYSLCEQRRFRRACASAQSRQNLRCSLIQAVSQEEPSDRKPDPWPLWMAGLAQLKFVMTECSKTQIRLTGLILLWYGTNSCSPTKTGNTDDNTWTCSLAEGIFRLQINYCNAAGQISHKMSHLMTKPTKWLCTQQRLRSAWASAQSEQSLRCALNG